MTRLPDDPFPLLSGGAETTGEAAAAQLLAKLPPSAEDHFARERIWRALGQPAGRSRRVWRPLTAAALGVALATIVVLTNLRPAPAILELAAGTVLLATPQADWTGARAGTLLPAASRVRTDDSSRAVIGLTRSAVIAEPGTDLGFEALGRHPFLRLSGGILVAEVDHRRADESFVVLTTRYRVTVKGTIFSVRERTPDDVEVSVSRGRVEVAGAGGTWLVEAGQAWASKHPADRGADTISEGQRELLDGTLHAGPRSPIEVSGEKLFVSAGGLPLGPTPVSWNAPLGPTELRGDGPAGRAVGEAVASAEHLTRVVLMPQRPPAGTSPEPVAVAPTEQSGPAPVLAPPSPPEPARTSPAIPPASRTAVPSPTPSVPVLPTRVALLDVPNRRQPEAASPNLSRAEVGPVPAAAPARRPDAPLAAALDLVRSHRYREAEVALTAISAQAGTDADLALYELADLRRRHLDDPAGALEALERYRTHYPRGALLQEAEISMIELELARPDAAAALLDINRFLSTYPSSERSPDVHWLQGNLLRAQGDFAGALAAYQGVVAGRHLEDAFYLRASCQQQLGQTSAAAETLRAYLQQFPAGSHADEAHRALGTR